MAHRYSQTTNLWEECGGIYYGFNSKGEEKSYTGDRHIVTIAPSESGKTRRLLLPNIFRLAGKCSMLVPDIKGELTWMLADYCRKMGSQVIVLNPFGVMDIPSDGFNPVASMAIDEEMPDNALGHAEATIRTNTNSHQPHFPQGAQDVFAGIEMYVRTVFENGSLEDVRTLPSYSTKDFQNLILDDEIQYGDHHYPGVLRAATVKEWPEIAAKLNRFSDLKPDNHELLGILSTALVQTRWLDSRPIKRELKGPKFDFTVMRERPVVVFLILPPKRLSTHSTWLRLIITSVIQALMNDVVRPKVPCLLALDEFYAIAEGGLDIIMKNMAAFRGYYIKLWTIWQDLSQIQKLVGKDGFETFLANAGVVQAFAPQDLTTSEYLSKRTGQTTKPVMALTESKSRSLGSPPSESATTSFSQTPQPLMLPQDVRNMEEGETLVLSHTLKPSGIGRYHCPYPTEIPGLEKIMRRDPSL